jgi:hypothetical protein
MLWDLKNLQCQLLSVLVFWDVTLCSGVQSLQPFRRTYPALKCEELLAGFIFKGWEVLQEMY